MSRVPVVVVCLIVVGLGSGLVWAQQGTPNLPSAVPWQADEINLTGEARFFEGSGNETLAVSLRGRMGLGSEAEICYFTMDTKGEDPINEIVRRSEADLVALTFKWLVRGGARRVAVRAGMEVPVSSRPTGTNTDSGAFAAQGSVIPTLSLPLEWGDRASTLFIIEPKAVWFRDNIPNSIGGVTPGFGDVIVLGAGFCHNLGKFTLVADAAVPLAGDNSIDKNTNLVTDEVVWAAGVSWDVGGQHDLSIDVFSTSAAGPTPATSIIAAPDQSGALGISVSGEF